MINNRRTPPVTKVAILLKSRLIKVPLKSFSPSLASPVIKDIKSLNNFNTPPIAPVSLISKLVPKNFATALIPFINLLEIQLLILFNISKTPEKDLLTVSPMNASGLSVVHKIFKNSDTLLITFVNAFLIKSTATFTPNKAY